MKSFLVKILYFLQKFLVNHSRVALKGKTVLDSLEEDGAMELKIPSLIKKPE